MKKEQSSTQHQRLNIKLWLKSMIKKIKSKTKKNKEKVDAYERLKTKESSNYHLPTGWRLLVFFLLK